MSLIKRAAVAAASLVAVSMIGGPAPADCSGLDPTS
jgi:hypothetical protein